MALPWFLAWLITVDSLLTAAGWSPGARPDWVKWVMLAVACVPVAILVFTPVFKEARGWRHLVAQPQPCAELGPKGMELRLPETGTQTFLWEQVGSLRMRNDLRMNAELRDPEDRPLARIPESLIYPGGKHWCESGDTFAEAIVTARPDRYVLTGPKSLITRPNEFSLRGQGPELDVASWRRRRNVVGAVLLVLSMLIIFGGLGLPLLNR
ncbi:MAG: hypothetical protein ACRDFR_04580 [Candidatus Limnocylindria bacterium]